MMGRAAEQAHEVGADDGDDGNEGVGQHVAAHNEGGGEPLGACGADVVLARDFDEGGAGDAGEEAHGWQGQRDGGQDDEAVEAAAVAGGREPAQHDGEEDLEHECEPEEREGEVERGDCHNEAVGPAVAAGGGDDAEPDAAQGADQFGGDGEPHRLGEDFDQVGKDRPPRLIGTAELSPRQVPEIVQVLDVKGAVEAHLLADVFDDVGICEGAGHHAGGVAGQDVEQGKEHGDETDEDGNEEQDAADDVGSHGSSATGSENRSGAGGWRRRLCLSTCVGPASATPACTGRPTSEQTAERKHYMSGAEPDRSIK